MQVVDQFTAADEGRLDVVLPVLPWEGYPQCIVRLEFSGGAIHLEDEAVGRHRTELQLDAPLDIGEFQRRDPRFPAAVLKDELQCFVPQDEVCLLEDLGDPLGGILLRVRKHGNSNEFGLSLYIGQLLESLSGNGTE